MTVGELKARHSILSGKMIATNVLANKQTKLSIQFAIEVLEEFKTTYNFSEITNKIQELKQYYDSQI
jgi:DNA-directed RNA polymerase delta subunit